MNNKVDWYARWISISCDKRKKVNQWLCFRKTFTIDSSGDAVPVMIAADSKYWLWINGKEAVHEGQLKRGPNPRDSYYDSFDISPYLKKGENQIALLLWYFGKEGFSHHSSGVPALLFQGDVKDSRLFSDRSWKVREHPAFGESAPPYPNFRLAESNIHFDSRLDIPGWHLPGFDDSRWDSASELGVPPVHPWNDLIERPIPLWKVESPRAYENAETFNSLRGTLVNLEITGDLPGNDSICPCFEVDAEAGKKISVYTDNYLGGGEYNLRLDYITKDGIQEFSSPAYLTGHKVIYQISPGIRILDLSYRVSRYDTELKGNFSGSDPFLNRLYKKALNTMVLNMRDGIQDPDRERAQWWGDVVILIGMILNSCDSKGVRGVRKAILNLVDWQKPDGVLYSPIPAGNWFQELPAQMLAAIGKYGFWYYFRYTGDIETIAHAYPAVKRYLEIWQIGSTGLVVARRGGWDWGDWGEHIDMPLLINCWFYMALESAVNMAQVLGKNEDASIWRMKMTALASSFDKIFLQDGMYRSPEFHGPPDERGQALAVISGLVNEALYPKIADLFKVQFHASPYMEKYVIEALFVMNRPRQALERMKTRYLEMVESQHSTLWESWSVGDQSAAKYGGGSYNHGWAGGPLTLMVEYIAGIRPEMPGFKRFSVKPQIGLLEEFECSISVADGLFTIKQSTVLGGFSLLVLVPEGSSGVLILPHNERIDLHVGENSFFCLSSVTSERSSLDESENEK